MDPAAAREPEPAGESAWTEQRFRIAVATGAVVVVATILWLRFGYELTVPPRPPRPEITVERARALAVELDRDPGTYAAHLASDAASLGIATPTAEAMSRAFPYRVDEQRRVLRPNDPQSSIEAAGLRLFLVVRPIKGTPKKVMVLQIENATDQSLAYRVSTVPSVGTQPCHGKVDWPHNALAIAPGVLEMRTECLYRDGWFLEVSRIETIALPELSYLYVSRLRPPQVGVEARVARGHQAPGRHTCQIVLPAPIVRALERGETTWRDMIDFYARHRCDTYTFPTGYKAFESDGERPLPDLGDPQ